MRFYGKTVIITGGASGIGRATALLFGMQGARVVIGDVLTGGRKVAEEIQKSGGIGIFVKTDVSKVKDIKNLIAITIKSFKTLDILVNNAGIAGPRASLVNLEEKDFDRLVGVNLKGAYLCSKHAIPWMKKGAIVNVASELALTGSPRHPIYSATKAGIVGLTKAMARDLGKRIRVNCVCPGPVDTPLLEEFMGGKSMLHFAASDVPLGRNGKPEEIANVIAFLASEEASFINGAIVVADGGATA
jgi:NAD(P)-dependent dehydrogenase (short-subunit alcohol dehydrogenase family)